MSIGPAISLSLSFSGEAASAVQPSQGRRPPQPHFENTDQPAPPTEHVPKQEAPAQNATSTVSQLPEDEVQLRRDSELKNELIVRYLDKGGNVILQVPSEQMLNFERAVAAQFKRAKPPATTEVAGQEGEPHGH